MRLRLPLAAALCAGLSLLPARAQDVDTTVSDALALYVSGHPDDWQLFRGNAAYDDLADPRTRVVFVYATAGDAGRTDGWWEARERGALASVRAGLGPTPLRLQTATFNGHAITRYVSPTTASYFLRLPDGRAWDGTGYAPSPRSLSGLRGAGQPVTAVDGSTTYASWDDFQRTLQAILDHERARVPADAHPWLYAPDYAGTDNGHADCRTRPGCNPCDHPDHKAVGDALRSFAAGTYRRGWWVSYDVQNRPENLGTEAFARKGRVFFAYAEAVRDETARNGAAVPPDLEEWRLWGGRDYVRTVAWDQPDPDAPACAR